MYTLNIYNFAYHLYLHKTGAKNTPKGDHHYVDYQGETGSENIAVGDQGGQ